MLEVLEDDDSVTVVMSVNVGVECVGDVDGDEDGVVVGVEPLGCTLGLVDGEGELGIALGMLVGE